jgi:hypothetical protein
VRKAVRLFAVLAVVCVPVGCGGDGDDEGSLTLVTDIDFSSAPYRGTFEVTEGADELGCSAGTFVDQNVALWDVHKVLTCTDGERSGSFTILFHPGPEEGAVSRWQFFRGTGDFTWIDGGGDFSVEYGDDRESGVETLTGDVGF